MILYWAYVWHDFEQPCLGYFKKCFSSIFGRRSPYKSAFLAFSQKCVFLASGWLSHEVALTFPFSSTDLIYREILNTWRRYPRSPEEAKVAHAQLLASIQSQTPGSK